MSIAPVLVYIREVAGGVFASYTASKNPAAGLILESTFTNAVEMADKLIAILPSWLVRSELNTQGYVSQLKMPKLFIHGTMDNLIPYTLGRELYEGAAQPKEFYSIAGAGHNNTLQMGGEEYFETIKEFAVRTVAGQ